MATKKRTYRWFVEPVNDAGRSNGVISDNLPNETDGSHQKCDDGKPHYLWNCTSKEAKNLWKSRHTLQINIQVWNQEGNGQIRRHTFFLKPKNPAVAAVKKQVAKMIARRKKCLQQPA